MIKKFFALGTLCSAIGCHCAGQGVDATCPQSPKSETTFRIARKGCLFGYVVDNATASRYYPEPWEPDDKVLFTFEKQLAETTFSVPDTYGRHYVGYHEKGEKVIGVSFFCDQRFAWHQREGGPADGQPCYLEALYFVDAQKIAPLWYTGPGGPNPREVQLPPAPTVDAQ